MKKIDIQFVRGFVGFIQRFRSVVVMIKSMRDSGSSSAARSRASTRVPSCPVWQETLKRNAFCRGTGKRSCIKHEAKCLHQQYAGGHSVKRHSQG